MRFTIGFKIFGIAVGLLLLMSAVALLNTRMTRIVDAQLEVVNQNYFPGFADLEQAHIRKLEQSSTSRRLLRALQEGPAADPKEVAGPRQRFADAAKASAEGLVAARRSINDQIVNPLDFGDDVALGRLDTRIEFLQREQQRNEALFAQLLAAANGDPAEADRLLRDVDQRRDEWDRQMNAAREEMHQIFEHAIRDTQAYQQRIVGVGLFLLAMAGLLGLVIAAIVTRGLVRPVHRLVDGTAAVEHGALDTVVPVTSRDEIGRLTRSFNTMVGELRVKAQIRETFGKYVDPRIVASLLDQPELADPQGSRREMTILFCDMHGFTSFSEGMTPTGLVTVLNRYLTVMSEPIRRNNGIIDKYIGDAVMGFWGPPFTGNAEHARLAAMAALEQLEGLAAFQAELPELMGIRRGVPQVEVRIGIATGEVVVGNIGSEHTRSYTVIGDTVNVASRLEGASKAYGTRVLINAATRRLAGAAIETREIDAVLVVGKSEPERIFELLGRRGEVGAERLELRDMFADGLDAYRAGAWERALSAFESCLRIAPDDRPSAVFLDRIAGFRKRPPADNWSGVWALETK
ncbi:MAG TPA: adenylate/guanylate cyclase domain-containing protein [Stellaceae bacterium]|nr:adenylate/guanylate cyclase domain-containing protein [Stellaceae bacterium]